MNNKLEEYIKNIVSSLTCSPNEKQEIANELRDHLYTAYESYLDNGCSHEEAVEKALNSFGQSNHLSIEFQQAVNPLYGWLRKLAWIGFILYSFAVVWKLLIFRMINRIREYYLFDDFFSISYVNTQSWLWTEKHFFDFSVWYLNVNFIPFKTIVFYLNGDRVNLDVSVNNLVGNLILLLPLGLLLPFMFKRCQKLSSVVAIAFITSLLIEVIQFVLQIGMADIDDVILNSLGAILGYIFYKFIMWSLTLRIKLKNAKILQD